MEHDQTSLKASDKPCSVLYTKHWTQKYKLLEVSNCSSAFVLHFLYREQLEITQSGLQFGKNTLRGNNSIVLSAGMRVEERTPAE